MVSIMSAYIHGIGALSACGFGAEALRTALKRTDYAPPLTVDESGRPGFYVDLSSAPDKSLLKKIRRADAFSKMSVLAAADAMRSAGQAGQPASISSATTGIILSTGLGPHTTTFKFLDDALDFGDPGVSPTKFSNSVHNAAASYIAETLALRGPTLTVTQFHHSFHQAMLLATLWLAQGTCDQVLVGGVDVYGDVLRYVSETKLPIAAGNTIRPFAMNPTGCLPGEGAAFFLLCSNSKGALCKLSGVSLDPIAPPSDLLLIDSDGMLPDERAYLQIAKGRPVAAYSPHYGSMMSASALSTAAAALMLAHNESYPSPITETPHGLAIADAASVPSSITICRYNCYAKPAHITLSRI